MRQSDTLYSRPIVVLYCEGPTDKNYVLKPFKAFFDEKFGGDVTYITISDLTGDPNIFKNEIVSSIKLLIEVQLSNSKFKMDKEVAKNIRKIVQIIDLDECFISDDRVNKDKNAKTFKYSHEGITFSNRNCVISRNANKREKIEILKSLQSINIFGLDIPYELYYYNINIDDYYNDNALNISNEQKFTLSCEMLKEYSKKETNCEIINFFLDSFKDINPNDFPDQYFDSWEFIKIDTNAVQKASNVFLALK